jgi:hypothetical protein
VPHLSYARARAIKIKQNLNQFGLRLSLRLLHLGDAFFLRNFKAQVCLNTMPVFKYALRYDFTRCKTTTGTFLDGAAGTFLYMW